MITIEKTFDGVNEQALVRFTRKAAKAIGLKGSVSLLVTSNAQMRKLNRRFRGKDKATDVISFPAVAAVADDFAGDLAISMDLARSNAVKLGHSTGEELRVLILHGLLHLAGYDHEADKGEMKRRESFLRRKLGLPSNLIARTEETAVRPTMTSRRTKTKKAGPAR